MKILLKVIALLVVITTIFSCSPIFATNDNPVQIIQNVTFDKKIGINGFIDCKFDNLKACGVFRENHNFNTTFDYNSKKCYFNNSSFNYDDFYKNLSLSGITVVPSIQQSFDKDNKENKPIEDEAEALKPESYKIHANVLFNYAARYGNSKVDKNKLNITQGTESISGLGYIKYYENWNAPDKTKYGDKAHFTAEEFAAMCSADYDGHEGLLGNTYGIKQADPFSKLVLGGISTDSDPVEYLDKIKSWSNENRKSKTLPFDVINFQYYSEDKSPESSEFVSKVNNVIKWRNDNAPGKEIWISGFGWDTNISSSNGAPSADTQRDWIIREFLLSDRLGLDRAIVSSLRDSSNANSTSSLATSGLTSQKGKEERKSSWYGVNTLKNTLSGFIFSGVIKEDSNLYIYKYINPTTNEDCFVLWRPTSDNSKVDNYELNVGANSGVTLIQMQNNNEFGVSSNLEVNDSIVSVNVSESPIFVKVSQSNDMLTLGKAKVDNISDINYQNTNPSNKDYASPITNSQQANDDNDLTIEKIRIASSLLSLLTFLGLFFI